MRFFSTYILPLVKEKNRNVKHGKAVVEVFEYKVYYVIQLCRAMGEKFKFLTQKLFTRRGAAVAKGSGCNGFSSKKEKVYLPLKKITGRNDDKSLCLFPTITNRKFQRQSQLHHTSTIFDLLGFGDTRIRDAYAQRNHLESSAYNHPAQP